MTDEQTQDMTPAESQDVDRIRDIIFGEDERFLLIVGPQMRDYQQRFQTLQRDLSRLQQEIDNLTQRLADQDSDQTKQLRSLRSEMREADDDLRDEVRQTAQALRTDKVDRAALGGLFIQLGTVLKEGGALGDLSGLLEDLVPEDSQGE